MSLHNDLEEWLNHKGPFRLRSEASEIEKKSRHLFFINLDPRTDKSIQSQVTLKINKGMLQVWD